MAKAPKEILLEQERFELKAKSGGGLLSYEVWGYKSQEKTVVTGFAVEDTRQHHASNTQTPGEYPFLQDFAGVWWVVHSAYLFTLPASSNALVAVVIACSTGSMLMPAGYPACGADHGDEERSSLPNW